MNSLKKEIHQALLAIEGGEVLTKRESISSVEEFSQYEIELLLHILKDSKNNLLVNAYIQGIIDPEKSWLAKEVFFDLLDMRKSDSKW